MDESCWMRVPYDSIFSTLVMFAGMGCFCGPLFIGVDELEQLLNGRDTFNLHEKVLWLSDIKVGLTIAAVVMGVYSIILLVFSVLATGSTRKNVYSGAKCIQGGRCSALFFLLVTYLFNFIWVAITSLMSIPLIFFVMMKSICDTEYGYNQYQPGDTGLGLHCFNLTRIGFYFPGYNAEHPDEFWRGPAVCEQSKLTVMCEVVTTEIPLFSAAFAGSLLIVISLVSFLMILSINYQRIKTSKELSDYRGALEQDTTEMDNIISSRRPLNSSSYATSQSAINT